MIRDDSFPGYDDWKQSTPPINGTPVEPPDPEDYDPPDCHACVMAQAERREAVNARIAAETRLATFTYLSTGQAMSPEDVDDWVYRKSLERA